METKHLGVGDMSRILKKELKQKFPNTKFSVRSQNYSGGCSIDVYYENGPSYKKVNEIVQKYSGKGFDGMVDMAYYKDLCLTKEGFLQTYKSEGTEDSNGYSRSWESELPEGAIPVSTSHPYVFTNREITEEVYLKSAKDMANLNCLNFEGMTQKPFEGDYRNWYELTRLVISDSDLSDFEGIKRSERDCGSFDDLYEVY